VSSFVGCREIDVREDVSGTFPMVVLYPTRSAERPEQVGRYVIDVAKDAPIDGNRHVLVTISHGSGGSNLTHRLLGRSLAQAGYVVGLPLHPRNNRDDNSLAGTDTLLENRPRELRAAIDAMYALSGIAEHLVADSVAAIGHSMGGYTALALAGGRPIATPHETADKQPRVIRVEPDPRVKALVLLAPATPWFAAPGALRNVRVPILMRIAEKDEHAPAWFAGVVKRGVPAPRLVEDRVVANAGHFAFLSPFPPEVARPDFAPSQDPPGFDRVRFQAQLADEIIAFLQRVL
jgi:predicted dienelactone hydrolase